MNGHANDSLSAPQTAGGLSDGNAAVHRKTMRAVVWEGKVREMSVKDVPKPRIEEATDVIVRVTWAAICGTDLHTYHGIFGGSDVPYVMGHEAIGVIEQVGDRVITYNIGDTVVIPDGNFAASGTNSFTYGFGNVFGKDIGGCQGMSREDRSFCSLKKLTLCIAEYVRVPAADINLIRIPQMGCGHELDFLLLSDIFATAWKGVTDTGFQPGDVVAVYGAGPVGLLAVYSALLRGASKVYSIDHVTLRLAKAKSIGAIPINLSKGDPAEQILKQEPSGVPRVVDCIGYECVNVELKPQENFVINNAVKLCAQDGGIGIIGVYASGLKNVGEPLASPKLGSIDFDVAAWWEKSINMKGQVVSAGTQEPALQQLISSGRARPSFVFDHITDIEGAPKAYRLFDDHKIQKAAIQFRARTQVEQILSSQGRTSE